MKMTKKSVRESIHRPKGVREIRDPILIVCGAEKTEPIYFREIKERWHLGPMHIKVIEIRRQNQPLNVVNEAIRRNEKRNKLISTDYWKYPYKETWCIFDHDNDPHLTEALKKAKENKFNVALSIPCFELWLLLHFKYTCKQFDVCQSVIRELDRKGRILGYNKTDLPMDRLLSLTSDAIVNARKLRKANQKDPSFCFSNTNIDLLVAYLMKMRI